MQTTKTPYELLVRFGLDGSIAGVHVQHRYVIDDSGQTRETLGDALALTAATAADFPVSEVIGHLQALAAPPA